MHGTITPAAPPPTAPKPEPKQRTITLTNRAPIQIVEDDWPVVAQGTCGWSHQELDIGWSIEIKVRADRFDRMIIHANYKCYDDQDDEDDSKNQRVRVGHYLHSHEASDLYKHIKEVGEELRSRIKMTTLKEQVVHALDACFASLKPRPC